MSIFDLHASVLQDYQRYVQSFLSISDEAILEFVERKLLEESVLWPDALIQLNPAYQKAETVDELVASGLLLPTTADIFRTPNGGPISLYQHQRDAIELAARKRSYVVTSGTGSGKSLTYFIPIFNSILRGNFEERKVWAIVVYPMNALVNSQWESLNALAETYRRRAGREMPVRFAKYTGQESDAEKRQIQEDRPHILLTNFVMLEMMLLRPQESAFVDRATAALQFLVLDELHMYRGRQGADVAMLVRRLKQRCGNPELLHIGTSATMISSPSAEPQERRRAVADFASRLFGTPVPPENIVEESLVPIARQNSLPTPEQLQASLNAPTPTHIEELVQSSLTNWLEANVGVQRESDGKYRRRPPLSVNVLAGRLSQLTGVPQERCAERLREMFLAGAQIRYADGTPVFAFKLHQFISQGRAVYATYEARDRRYLTLDGQYYAPGTDGARILFPLAFCRVCGQEYYKVHYDESNSRITPWGEAFDEEEDEQSQRGYLMMPPSENFDWSADDLPPEWLNANGRVRSNYKKRLPRLIHVAPDGAVFSEPGEGAVNGYFQPSPFLLCLACGEYYTGRQREFTKLSGLSSEGRSSATTVLGISALDHAEEAGISASAKKLLSFTDNRQDASLQAGHCNDFVRVSLLRGAIYEALRRHGELRHFDIARKTKEVLAFDLRDVAQNPQLDPASPHATTVWKCFEDLIEYRIYEDLRRAWRIVHPNLEQCGLLRVDYEGLESLCSRDDLWQELPPLARLSASRRLEILRPILDFCRKKLAIRVECLRETYQQQLRQRVNQVINDRWNFDESEERLRQAERLILPDQPANHVPGVSLSARSLVGRYLRRRLPDISDYSQFVRKLVTVLASQGLLRLDRERGVEYVQLDAAVLIWRTGQGEPPPPDPIYSRRAISPLYVRVQQKANEFFRELYSRRALSLRSVEGLPHTAQIHYADRQERERRFREGNLPLLFCSPTMELGIDIRDLQLVHLRNIPPTPASYAQRSGRAGRKGDPALILAYCAAGSGHDQYFFRRREEIVAGAVRPPRIDLSNEDLVRAHIHALWFSKVNLRIERSIDELLELQLDDLPLKDSVRAAIELSEDRLRQCIEEGRSILDLCAAELKEADWFTPTWLEGTLRRASQAFNEAFDRWRQLYRAATTQLLEAQRIQATSFDERQQREAKQRVEEAVRQRNLLTNTGTLREESDFYPYRYLASEGFLPGYNFPRLPVRVYIPREDGEFISRPRFLAITEFGPDNLIYHEGAKYQVRRFWTPPGGLAARCSTAKLCHVCGYFNSGADDRCGDCQTVLDGSTSLFVNLLEMPNAKTIRRERITCDEEERVRRGYHTSIHFRFAPGAGGRLRTIEAMVGADPTQPLLRTTFAPAATLFKVNHGWKGGRTEGFLLNLANGEINPDANQSPGETAILRLFVSDTENLLLVRPRPEIQRDPRALASLQFALQRGMEQHFQLEESELASERVGTGDHRAILYWEAAEGGVGVLRRLVEEQDLFAAIASTALERLHFDLASLEDRNPDCAQACYECLLSYTNQLDHRLLNRHLVRDVLNALRSSLATPQHAGRDYEEHYRWLRSLTDSRSELERRFIDHLYQTRRNLPDEAQKAVAEVNTIPDFYYSGCHACVFCDGAIHDEPAQQQRDKDVRRQLRESGYRVIVIRYDRDLETQIAQYPDVFGEARR